MTTNYKHMVESSKRIHTIVYNDFMERTANPLVMMAARLLLPALKSLGPKVMGSLSKIPPDAWASIIPTLIKGLAPKMKAPNATNAPAGRQASSDEEEEELPGDFDASAEPEDKEAIGPLAGLAVSTLAPMAMDALSDDDDAAASSEEEEPEDFEAIGPLAGLAVSTLAPIVMDKLMGDDAPKSAKTAAYIEIIDNSLRLRGVKDHQILSRALYLAAIETGNSHREKSNPLVVEALKLVKQFQLEIETIREFI